MSYHIRYLVSRIIRYVLSQFSSFTISNIYFIYRRLFIITQGLGGVQYQIVAIVIKFSMNGLRIK